MTTYYRTVEVSAVEPSNLVGQKRIIQIGDTYQEYMFINDWTPLISGGIVNTDYDTETLIENVIIQETQPATAKIGDIWIKMSTAQAFKYFWSWHLYAGTA